MYCELLVGFKDEMDVNITFKELSIRRVNKIQKIYVNIRCIYNNKTDWKEESDIVKVQTKFSWKFKGRNSVYEKGFMKEVECNGDSRKMLSQ